MKGSGEASGGALLPVVLLPSLVVLIDLLSSSPGDFAEPVLLFTFAAIAFLRTWDASSAISTLHPGDERAIDQHYCRHSETDQSRNQNGDK